MTIASRFVPAGAPDYGARKGPAAGFVVHMTEGNGNENEVRYLAGDPARGVSVHYLILATGEIVQMLREARASGSLNPRELRTTDDAPFTSPDGVTVRYGASAAKAVLGSWWRDPNSAVISVEVGGHAVDGPNARQSAALARLFVDVAGRHPGIRPLGHRDFTSTKGCPGKKVRWASLGGHGAEENDVVHKFSVPHSGNVIGTVPKGEWLYDNSALQSSPGNVQVSSDRDVRIIGKPAGVDVFAVAYQGPDDRHQYGYFIATGKLTNRREFDPTPLDDADLTAATAPLQAEIDALNAKLAAADTTHRVRLVIDGATAWKEDV